MHECPTICDFSLSIPDFQNAKPAPFRNLSQRYVSESIRAIVCDVDRFYNPKIFYRRRFTLDGVTKYAKISKLRKNVTFLHGNTDNPSPGLNKRKVFYKRSVSMFESGTIDIYFRDNQNNTYDACDDKYIVQDFIDAEKYASYMETGKTYFLKKLHLFQFVLF